MVQYRLKELLLSRGITNLKGFSREVGVRYPMLLEICDEKSNGPKHLPTAVIDKICRGLDVQPGEWIKWDPLVIVIEEPKE